MTGPLAGLRVWLTRPAPHDETSARVWTARGADVVRAPTVRVEARRPDADEVARVDALDDAWIVLPSPRAAENLAAARDAFAVSLRAWPVAAVGDASAEAARAAGFDVRVTATRATGADLARQLLSEGGPPRVVIASSDRRREELGAILREAGRTVVDLVVHHTLPSDGLPSGVGDLDAIDLIAVYSPSALAFVATLAPVARGAVLVRPVACLGETSAAAARTAGFDRVILPDDPGEVALIERVIAWWSARDGG